MNLRTSLLVGLLLGSAAFAYFLFRPGETDDESRYRFEAARRGPLTQTVSANGTLNPVSLISIGTQVSGTVKQLHVDFNSRVQRDQVLLELDDALYRAQVRQSEANLLSAQSALALARSNAQRTRELVARDYVPKQQLDQSEQALRAAEAQVAQAQAQLDRDRANLDYTIIRSPVDGIVVNRVVDIGQTVAASFQTPTLIQLAQDLARMQINSSFAEADIGQIKVGQQARFKVDAYPGRDFSGSVRQIRLNPTNVQNVVTYDVVVAVDNPELILLPGMTAYVNIILSERSDALLIPNNALRFRPADDTASSQQRTAMEGAESKTRIHVLRNGRLQAVTITPGVYDNRNTEVLDGTLQAGDLVAVGEQNSQGGANDRPMKFRGY